MDTKIEKSVLSVLFNTDFIEGSEMLDAECFHDPHCARIFSHIIEESRPIDLQIFRSKLEAQGVVDDIGGVAFIAEIYTYQPTSAHFKNHVKILIDLKWKETT